MFIIFRWISRRRRNTDVTWTYTELYIRNLTARRKDRVSWHQSYLQRWGTTWRPECVKQTSCLVAAIFSNFHVIRVTVFSLCGRESITRKPMWWELMLHQAAHIHYFSRYGTHDMAQKSTAGTKYYSKKVLFNIVRQTH